MNLEHQVCSLDLAKRLKELGVKQESLFVWCEYSPASPPWTMKYAVARFGDVDDYAYEMHRDLWSAFTVAELGEMLPDGMQSGRNPQSNKYVAWQMNHFPDFYADIEADARAKMLIYLLENKLCNPVVSAAEA